MNLPICRLSFFCLATLLAFLALGPVSTSARAIANEVEPNAVALSPRPAKLGASNYGPTQGWVCRPQRDGWCTISIVVEYNNIPNIHSELFDDYCQSLATLPHIAYGTLYTLSAPSLPRAVRVLVKPVMSAVSPDVSEFWYGDGHWVGNWEQYIEGNMTDNNFRGISTRPFDCSFTQGHNASAGGISSDSKSAMMGVLVGLLVTWVVLF
ncbi:hypothetical protein QBC34DRAFT_386508 [Podospora aff. communis PSN243]|uniref:Ecp2 effector protein domain-containing protein n=1 Tax=Podospora aff. communis PSN243 TaxID=3040156 RepID=A0AAV9G6V8_9PEZI|nr:hypothetical protein QBC34DRAFT_386508 [Podospora aff. communis PSN243]